MAFFSAEEINYRVKFKNKSWRNSLANPGSEDYTELEDKIKKDVNIIL